MFPQELVLKFDDGTVQIQTVQLLCHETKIASKVEIYIGNTPDLRPAVDVTQATFVLLGFARSFSPAIRQLTLRAWGQPHGLLEERREQLQLLRTEDHRVGRRGPVPEVGPAQPAH